MTNKVKKEPRTIYLFPATWEKIDQWAADANRRPAQEIEQIIKVIGIKRQKDNDEAIRLATADNPPQT